MNIPLDILKIVATYLTKPKMKLLDWIPLYKLNWDNLSRNPGAIHLLEQNMNKIDWLFLSKNPNIFEIDTNQLKINADDQAKIIDKIIHQ